MVDHRLKEKVFSWFQSLSRDVLICSDQTQYHATSNSRSFESSQHLEGLPTSAFQLVDASLLTLMPSPVLNFKTLWIYG